MSKRYKSDATRVLKEATRHVIPLNNGSTEEGQEQSVTCVALTFAEGDTYAYVKQQTRLVLKELGCNRAEAQRYLKIAFPEIF